MSFHYDLDGPAHLDPLYTGTGTYFQVHLWIQILPVPAPSTGTGTQGFEVFCLYSSTVALRMAVNYLLTCHDVDYQLTCHDVDSDLRAAAI